ncbi:MAG: RsmE family RNA methyltransferase [Patescibacteria group bacterium]
MRLHRFYIGEKVGPQTEIVVHSTELVNQVRKVFRLKTDDSIIVFDGSGSDYECRIADFSKDSLTLDIQNASRSRCMPSRTVYLYAALVKKDTFEWITEKATELGVTHIVPVMAERSEKKNLNEARLKKIAVEASEQSGRGDVPTILPLISCEEAIAKIGQSDGHTIAFHTEGHALESSTIRKDEDVALFIGPEGGWSPHELDLFHKNEIPVVCLGTQVLRAETAVIAALSVVMLGK